MTWPTEVTSSPHGFRVHDNMAMNMGAASKCGLEYVIARSWAEARAILTVFEVSADEGCVSD
jgi:hypothetical protein